MKILVSACLLGFDVKYDGGNNGGLLPPETLEHLKKSAVLIPVCPESFGGLSCPRSPCEISDGRVLNSDGEDKTDFFKKVYQKLL